MIAALQFFFASKQVPRAPPNTGFPGYFARSPAHSLSSPSTVPWKEQRVGAITKAKKVGSKCGPEKTDVPISG